MITSKFKIGDKVTIDYPGFPKTLSGEVLGKVLGINKNEYGHFN